MLIVRGCNQAFDLALRHAFVQCVVNRFIYGKSDLRGQTHQRDFVGAFDHAATGSDWRGAGDGQLRCRFCNPVCENEAQSFLRFQIAGRDAAIF